MSSLYIARASTDALIHWTLQLRSPALHVPTTDHLISPNETTNPMWHTHLIRHTESSTVGSVVWYSCTDNNRNCNSPYGAKIPHDHMGQPLNTYNRVANNRNLARHSTASWNVARSISIKVALHVYKLFWPHTNLQIWVKYGCPHKQNSLMTHGIRVPQ